MSHAAPTLQFQTQHQAEIQHFPVDELGIIEVVGSDAEKFLQGQLTCDLPSQVKDRWSAGGYCDAKGKLWSTFRIFRRTDGFWLLLAKSSVENTLTQLKKYAVFSKVSISDVSDMHKMTAFWGLAAAKHHGLPESMQVQQDATQTQLAISQSLVLVIHHQPFNDTLTAPHWWWQAAQLELGWVDVPSQQVQAFIPQMLNLDENQGINFKKGCYIGQETVARMHYKGQNKRRTRCFVSQKAVPADYTCDSDATLEIKIGENWRRAGAVLHSVRYDDGVVALFAVVSTDLDPTSTFRMNGQDDSQFTLCPVETKMEPHS